MPSPSRRPRPLRKAQPVPPPPPPPLPMDAGTKPIAWPLPKAPVMCGLSRATLYKLNRQGRIRLFKVGRSTLVDAESVRAFLAAAPAL